MSGLNVAVLWPSAYTVGLAESGLILPHVPDWAEPAWHLYVVRTSDREALQDRMTEAGIGTLIHYPIPPHMQKAYLTWRYARGTTSGP